MKKALLILLLALCLLLTACTQERVTLEAPELLPAAGVASDTFTVFRGDVWLPKVYEASVVPYVEELSVPMNVYVDEVLVLSGEQVQAGQKLVSFQLDSKREQAEELTESIAYQKQVNELNNRIAEVGIARIRNDLTRMRVEGKSAKEMTLRELDLEQAQLDLRHARETQQANLDEMELRLEKLNEELANDGIYAPFDGRIANILSIKSGDRISAFQPVICLADDTRLSVSTEYIADSTFATATGGVYALIGDKQYDVARVPMDTQEYLKAALAGKTVNSTFALSEEAQAEVSAGDYCAFIMRTSYYANQLLVPANAVLQDSESKYVYVVGKNGTRERRDIRVRVIVGAVYSVVLEGLEEGEVLYVTDK